MKDKATPATAQAISSDHLLDKREALVVERDAALAKVAELNAGIEALDTVMTMFNPKHVPLDIRRIQAGASIITLSAQPLIESVAEVSATPEAKTVETTETTEDTPKRRGRRSKAEIPPAEVVAEPDEAALKAKAKEKDKIKAAKLKKKKADAAREKVKPYFEDIDKLDTLLSILKSDREGLPLRAITDEFLKKHPLDVSDSDVRKAFRDRISNILYSLRTQKQISRVERNGTEGPEHVWLYHDGQEVAA